MDLAAAYGPSWYEVVEGRNLEQGDLLVQCPVVVAHGDIPTEVDVTLPIALSGRVATADVMVLSQSCDITVQRDGRRRVDHVVVCPVWEVQTASERFSRSMIGNVLAGRVPTWHALAPCTLPGLERRHLFMELRRILTVPVEWAEAIAAQRSPRLRLRSPWKEHMAAAVGNLFSRPALPYPIPPVP